MDDGQKNGEIIAIRAVEWMAADADELHKFMQTSGESLESLRSRLNDPEFLAAVLDYVLASEKRLLAFCESAALPPDAPQRARHFLPGGDIPHWT